MSVDFLQLPMASLYIPNVPQELYTQIQQLALSEHRSLNEQVIVLLETMSGCIQSEFIVGLAYNS